MRILFLLLAFQLFSVSESPAQDRRRAMMVQQAATAGGGFTPASIPGLLLWIEPSVSGSYIDTGGSTPATANGDTVGRASDLSGNVNHATEATSPPFLTNNCINGKAALRFTSGKALSLVSVVNSASMTVFTVSREMDTRMIVLGGTVSFFGSFSTDGFLFRGQSDDGADVLSGMGTTTAAVWCGKQSTTAGTVYKNGASVGTGTFSTGVSFIYLGVRDSGGGQYSNGEIGAIIVYDSALSDVNRGLVESYLAGRYIP